MKSACLIILALIHIASAEDAEFRHIGDFMIYQRVKISADQITPTTIKPLRLSVFTNGIHIRISTKDDAAEASEYRIYRSDGIAQQQGKAGALEVVPGLQAISENGGVLRQLRLTNEHLSITSFPGISNQIIIMRARAIEPPKATRVADPILASPDNP